MIQYLFWPVCSTLSFLFSLRIVCYFTSLTLLLGYDLQEATPSSARPPIGGASGLSGSLDAKRMLDVLEMTKVLYTSSQNAPPHPDQPNHPTRFLDAHCYC
eukprot:559261-Pelagomonas_calceolata.AAC.4